MAPAPCARCGGPNPPGARVCQWCQASLPAPVESVPGPGGYRSLELPSGSRGPGLGSLPTTSPWLYLRVAIPLIIFGVIALGASAAIHQGVVTYNQGCSQIPDCVPQSDPSGGVAALGIILLVIGIALLAYALSLRSSGD